MVAGSVHCSQFSVCMQNFAVDADALGSAVALTMSYWLLMAIPIWSKEIE